PSREGSRSARAAGKRTGGQRRVISKHSTINHGITRNYTDEDLNFEVGCNETTISVCFRVVPWLCCF
ncbi:MAG: hypothetical protein OEM98_15185, partial [Gammaproteobacteria bacterium]|nr:hypothetical protein [Gammaproteobacteria bacterium]